MVMLNYNLIGSLKTLPMCHQLANLQLRAFVTSECRHRPKVNDERPQVLTVSPHSQGVGTWPTGTKRTSWSGEGIFVLPDKFRCP